MKRHYTLAALAAALALTWGSASAQTSRAERADGFGASVSYASYLKGKDLRASDIVGARVRNAAGESIGSIQELVIPSGDREEMRVIVSVGGVLDVGDKRKLVALPYKDLRVSPDGDTFYIDRTEAQLAAAPTFTYDGQAEAQARREPVNAPRADRDTSRTADRDTPRAAERDDRAADRDQARTPASAARTEADRPRTGARTAAANVVLDSFDYRASDIIGATVLDDRGESVAKIDDIVVSTEDDKLHAVLAFGGFVGFGAKLISLPFDDLQITADGDKPQVRIAMTGEQLQQLVAGRPEFRYERQVAQAPGNAPRG